MSDLLEATCPNCSKTKKIRQEWLGRKIQCPCGNEFVLAYPAVKKGEVDKSPIVEPRKASKTRKKSDVPVVQAFEIKKTLLGAYNAWYKCPHCKATLHSDESELQGRDRCPDCNRPFRVSEDAIAEIDSRRERVRAEKERKKQEKKNQSKKLESEMILIEAPLAKPLGVLTNLTLCPDCGHQISTNALVCPRCGCPIGEPNISLREPGHVQTIERTGKKFKLAMLLSACLSIAGCIGFSVNVLDGPVEAGSVVFWSVLFFSGLIGFIFVRILAWWHHG